jgi:uncharacterized membrane protein
VSPLFLGRFHPLLVHFPIALLLAAGGLEAWASWCERRGRPTLLRPATGPLLALAAASAVVAATAGYLLGASGGYAGEAFETHRWLGLSLGGLALATAAAFLVARRRPGRPARRVYLALLGGTLVLMVATGHAGGTLTHGEDYLTRDAPAPVRALVDRLFPPEKTAVGAPEQRVAYTSLVQPILRAHCVACHEGASARGGLRLDAPEGIRKGGEHGPVVLPGRAASSEMMRRIWLPPSHRDTMPAGGRRPVSAAEGAVLRWWIDQGAPFDAKLGDLEVSREVRDTIEATVGKLAPGGPQLPPVQVAEPDSGAMAAAMAQGLTVQPIAVGIPFVSVRATDARETDDTRIGALRGLAPQVVWLDLAGTSITDGALAIVGRLPHLVRLDLSRTAVTDAGLAHLEELAYLESLNLYGTRVGDAGLACLERLPRLRSLYVWGAAATPSGIARLEAARRGLRVEAGQSQPVQPQSRR